MPNMYCEKEREHAAAARRAKEEVMSSSDVEKLCTTFRMLAEPVRAKILLALMKGDMCVYHLAEVTNSTVSGVSHQLRMLRDNNVVKAERIGKNVEYSIADSHIQKIIRTAIAHLPCEVED